MKATGLPALLSIGSPWRCTTALCSPPHSPSVQKKKQEKKKRGRERKKDMRRREEKYLHSQMMSSLRHDHVLRASHD